jgi:hypothetical protein
MKIIVDDEAKDDLLQSGTPGTTDLGTLAQLAKAEYYRVSSAPLTGSFTTRLVKDLWAGQKIVVNAKKRRNNTYALSDTFRVTQFDHLIVPEGYYTVWQVTDDLTNSHTQPAYHNINKQLRAIRPEFQDKQATSIKMRDIDITQPLLVESY